MARDASPSEQATALFTETFGARAAFCVSAPGRVNVIGEHTDYNGGFVMPIAIDKRTAVAGVRNPSGSTCRIVSVNAGGRQVVTFRATKSGLTRGEPAWANYVKGVVAQYLRDLPGHTGSFDLAFASDVPLGGGLSSSASLEVATAVFIETAYGLRIDPKLRALRCQKCEHDFAGVPCGIMDQMISSCGVAGHALLIDCLPPYETTRVPMNDPSVAFVVTNSNMKHELTGSEYPDRVRECHSAALAIRKRFPSSESSSAAAADPLLRGCTMAELQACKNDISPVELKRARHAITEDVRTLNAVEAFRRRDYASAGQLMLESHKSLRDDFGVSTPELDALVEIAMSVDGVYGARMTGGGFGGCTVALVRAERAPELIAALQIEYRQRTGKEPTCFITAAGTGPVVSRCGLDWGTAARLGAGITVGAIAVVCFALLAPRSA